MSDATIDGKTVVKLKKPILVMGQSRDELSFREPTAEDIERFGFPLLIDDAEVQPEVADVTRPAAPDIRFDEKKMTAHLAVLSNVPIADIRKLSPGDWLRCSFALSVHFLG